MRSKSRGDDDNEEVIISFLSLADNENAKDNCEGIFTANSI